MMIEMYMKQGCRCRKVTYAQAAGYYIVKVDKENWNFVVVRENGEEYSYTQNIDDIARLVIDGKEIPQVFWADYELKRSTADMKEKTYDVLFILYKNGEHIYFDLDKYTYNIVNYSGNDCIRLASTHDSGPATIYYIKTSTIDSYTVAKRNPDEPCLSAIPEWFEEKIDKVWKENNCTKENMPEKLIWCLYYNVKTEEMCIALDMLDAADCFDEEAENVIWIDWADADDIFAAYSLPEPCKIIWTEMLGTPVRITDKYRAAINKAVREYNERHKQDTILEYCKADAKACEKLYTWVLTNKKEEEEREAKRHNDYIIAILQSASKTLVEYDRIHNLVYTAINKENGDYDITLAINQAETSGLKHKLKDLFWSYVECIKKDKEKHYLLDEDICVDSINMVIMTTDGEHHLTLQEAKEIIGEE